MDDKIIVSNHSALTAKYGKAGVAKIKSAIKSLIAADAKRGIKSRLVYLDRPSAMKRKAVTNAASPRQNKEAMDAIFRKENPEYLMILGATDVVPHQDITNPIQPPEDDPDPVAFGDLPYACDAPYSRDIAKFKGPTRVVGRLPDLPRRDRTFVFAQGDRSRGKLPKSEGRRLRQVFRAIDTLLEKVHGLKAFSTCLVTPRRCSCRQRPARGIQQSASHRSCISSTVTAVTPTRRSLARKGGGQPNALTSKTITRMIKPGTVAAVECCYGAQLYDSVTLAKPIPICQHYLRQGAYGFLGSTTIAYGPEDTNGSADFITQYFLLAVLDGASLGRAALVARQRFIQQTTELDVFDLKTLAQFHLLGDPSIHPVKAENPAGVPKGIRRGRRQSRQARRERRRKLKAMGEFLRDHKPTASRKASKGARSRPRSEKR